MTLAIFVMHSSIDNNCLTKDFRFSLSFCLDEFLRFLFLINEYQRLCEVLFFINTLLLFLHPFKTPCFKLGSVITITSLLWYSQPLILSSWLSHRPAALQLLHFMLLAFECLCPLIVRISPDSKESYIFY